MSGLRYVMRKTDRYATLVLQQYVDGPKDLTATGEIITGAWMDVPLVDEKCNCGRRYCTCSKAHCIHKNRVPYLRNRTPLQLVGEVEEDSLSQAIWVCRDCRFVSL